MKKIIFLIIIATIIVYGLFYLLKLLLFNNNASGLKTFIDPEQVYSFQYPSNLVQQTDFDVQKSFTGSRSKYGSDLVSFYVNGDKEKSEKLLATRSYNPSNLDIKERINKIDNTEMNKQFEEKIINGYEALITRTVWPCSEENCDENNIQLKQTHVSFKKGKFIINFKINTLAKFDPINVNSIADEKWLEQIVSTFKFINTE